MCAPNYPLAMKHVSRIHSHSSQFSITCGIDGCLSSYRSYTGWQKHIKNKHKTANNDITYNDGAGFEETEIDDVYLQEATAELNSENDKKREIAKWVLHLRDENKLTQSTTENILSNITTLCSQLVDEIKQRIREQLSDGQVTGDTVTKVLETLERDDFKQPFKGLETKHQQLSFLQQHLSYVVSINYAMVGT